MKEKTTLKIMKGVWSGIGVSAVYIAGVATISLSNKLVLAGIVVGSLLWVYFLSVFIVGMVERELRNHEE